MSNTEDNDTPQVDEETRERSAEQRNITAPTPPDVRDKGQDDETDPAVWEPRPDDGHG
ncbi:hypothetical protein [Streptomyces sp. NPDC007905]|uniref:hypothetical protein n=1 Tax=Streptomyces sp. NPDC007905 TaxID=3364788 RepID=UPI0036E5C13A